MSAGREDLPRFGEGGLLPQVLVGFDRCVEHILEHFDREMGCRFVRDEPIRLTGDGHRDPTGRAVSQVDLFAGEHPVSAVSRASAAANTTGTAVDTAVLTSCASRVLGPFLPVGAGATNL